LFALGDSSNSSMNPEAEQFLWTSNAASARVGSSARPGAASRFALWISPEAIKTAESLDPGRPTRSDSEDSIARGDHSGRIDPISSI
jgi:hypothetical protein